MYEYGPMMNGNENGWGILMMFFWLVVLLVVVVVAMRLFKEHNHQVVGSNKPDPLEIVKERYAKGEITKAEFEQLKKDLK